MIKEYNLSSAGRQVYNYIKVRLNAPAYRHSAKKMIVHVKSTEFDLLREGLEKWDFNNPLTKNEIEFMGHILKRAAS